MTSTASALTDPHIAMPNARIDAAGATHVGRVRSKNEDAYLIATLQRSMVVHDAMPESARGWLAGPPAGTLLIVADGMGGHGSGDLASKTAIQSITSFLLNAMPWAIPPEDEAASRQSAPSLVGVRDQLSTAVVNTDQSVKATGVQAGNPRMGTTLTLALVVWPVLYVAHVGDTRCYLWRDNQLTRLTTDHTVAQQLAEHSPQPLDPRSPLHSMLWNSLGGSEHVPVPQISKLPLRLGDQLLLCSDGLDKHVSDAELAQVLALPETPAARCQRLIDRANAEGGTDNVSVVIAMTHSE